MSLYSYNTLRHRLDKLEEKLSGDKIELPPIPDSLIEFTKQFRVLNRQPFSFDYVDPKRNVFIPEARKYLYDIYNCNSDRIVVVKGRQMEITEFATNYVLHNALKHQGCTIIYTSPRQDQVNRFSKRRLRKAIYDNQLLRGFLPEEPSVHEVNIGESVTYLFSAWHDMDALRNIAGDIAIIDECLSGDTVVLRENGCIDCIREVKNKDNVYLGGNVANRFSKYAWTNKIHAFSLLECSLNHPHLVIPKSSLRQCEEISAKDVTQKTTKELSIGDYMLVPESIPHKTLFNWAPDQLAFVAQIMCDGHIQKYSPTIQVNVKKDSSWHRGVFLRGVRSFGYEHRFREKVCKNETFLYQCYSRDFVNLLQAFELHDGKKSRDITINNQIFCSPIESIKAFIDSCFCCEGWVGKRDISLCSCSKDFVIRLQIMLLKFGVHSTLTEIRSKDEKHGMLYMLSVYGASLDKFKILFPLSLERKNTLLQSIKSSNRINTHKSIVYNNEKVVLHKIRRIDKHNGFRQVYDFTTDTHLFIANGFITHNCQDIELDALPVLEEALSHSSLNKMLVIGTPKDAGSRFEKIWRESSQREWDKEREMWVAKQPPDPWEGFHISQSLAPWISPESIEYKRRRYVPQKFENEVLGLFFKGAGRPLTVDDMEAVTDNTLGFLNKVEPPRFTYAGVDWGGGGNANTVFFALEADDKGGRDIPTYKVVYIENISQTALDPMGEVNRIDQLINLFAVKRLVADIGFGNVQVSELRRKYGERVMGCLYLGNVKEPIKYRETSYGMVLEIDRSVYIDKTIDVVKRKRVIIPGTDRDKKEWLWRNFVCLYLEAEETTHGRRYRRWQHDEGEQDDLFQAFNYALIAYEIDTPYRGASTNVISFGEERHFVEFGD